MLTLAPQQLLQLSSRLLLSGLALLVIGLLAAYGLQRQLSLQLLVLAHSLTVIGPGLLKLGYVLRLAAQHGLQRGEPHHATA